MSNPYRGGIHPSEPLRRPGHSRGIGGAGNAGAVVGLAMLPQPTSADFRQA